MRLWVIVVLTAQVACGEQGVIDLSSAEGDHTQMVSPFSDRKVVLDLESMAIHSSRSENPYSASSLFPSLRIQGAAKQESLVIPKATPLIALVDNVCRQAERGYGMATLASVAGVSALTGQPFDQQILELKEEAHSFKLQDDVKMGDLEGLVGADPCIIGVTNDLEMSLQLDLNDSMFSQQEHFATIEAPAAYDILLESDRRLQKDVVIAIIDSGVQIDHPDLKDALWVSPTDGSHGYDFIDADNVPDDENGHGTHVAGLAAGFGNNGVGISGIMPKNQKIMALKVFDATGQGGLTPIINAINYAAEKKVDVINMSLGGPGASPGVEQALQNAVRNGVVVLVAAGNDGRQLTATNFFSPASYGAEIRGVVTVGSVDSVSKARSSFSNYSTTYVEIGSPGSRSGTGGILSTMLGSKYGRLQGTSMATPVACGAAALAVSFYKTHNVRYDPATVESLLTTSATSVTGLRSFFTEGRLLNVSSMTETLLQSLIDEDGGISL